YVREDPMIGRSWRTPRHSLRLLVIVCTALAPLALPISPRPVSAQTSATPKIATALQALMTANPTQLQPIILQMTESSAPFTSSSNLTLAQQAVSILRANGQVVGALPILDGAAGYANAAGIVAMSLLPQVATIDQDAVVRARRPSTSGPPWPAGKLNSLYSK